MLGSGFWFHFGFAFNVNGRSGNGFNFVQNVERRGCLQLIPIEGFVEMSGKSQTIQTKCKFNKCVKISVKF
jgi:hypothetical protein